MRVLVGGKLDPESEHLASRPEVEVHTDAKVLAQRVSAEEFELVVVDLEMSERERAVVARATPRVPTTPMVFLCHSQVVPLVKAVLDLRDWVAALPRRGEGSICPFTDSQESTLDWTSSLIRSAFCIVVMSAESDWSEQGKWTMPYYERLRLAHDASSWRVHDAGKAEYASARPDAMSLLVRNRSAAEETDLKRRALEASFRERERLLQGSLSTQEVARLLGVTRQTPHDRVKVRSLLAIEDKGQLRFPLWQFDAEGPDGTVSGLPMVLRELKVGAFAQARWLERPNGVFEGRSPIAALKDGEVERVIREARSVGASLGNG